MNFGSDEPTLSAAEEDLINDSMTVLASKIPPEGMTVREFMTKSAKLSGQPMDAVELVLKMLEEEGTTPDQILMRGENCIRLQ